MMEEKKLDQNTSADAAKNDAAQKPALPPHKEYAKRVLSFKSKYIFILTLTFIILGAGFALAMLNQLLIGLALALLGIVFYARFTSNDMYDTLGIDYKTYESGLKVTLCRARYGDVVWVPSSLIRHDVTRIEDEAFNSAHNAELRCVFLPKTLVSIGKDIFKGCDALETVFFEGTEEQWQKIEKETDFSALNITFEAKYPPVKKRSKDKKAKK